MASDVPTGRDREQAELLTRLWALKSLIVVKRFAWKIGFFVLIAAMQAAAGRGFLRHLVSLALVSTIITVVAAHWHREHVDAPYYTYLDEAAWFMLLALTIRAYA